MKNLQGQQVPDPQPIKPHDNPVRRLLNGDIEVIDVENGVREVWRTVDNDKVDYSYRRIKVEPI